MGHWQARIGNETVVLTLEGDGTGYYGDARFRWSLEGGRLLTANDQGGFEEYRVALQGDRLLLTRGDLQVPFTRTAVVARAPGLVRGGPGEPPGPAAPVAQARDVTINGTSLTDEQVSALETGVGVRVQDGSYWYDPMCGAWGFSGGPTAGFLPAGLKVGGRLPRDASGGATGVILNGRELHVEEVLALLRLTPVSPGRYWMDARGNVGYEGDPIPILNLVQLSAGSGGGSSSWRSDITGVGGGSTGRASYVMGSDWSVMVDD